MCLLLSGCFSLVKVDKQGYAINRPAIIKDLESLESQRHLADSATTNLKLTEKIFYEGTEAKSPDAKALRTIGYSLAGYLGLSADDIDIENLAKTMEKIKAGNKQALEELQERNKKLEMDVDSARSAKLEIEKVKKGLELQNTKWRTTFSHGMKGFFIMCIIIIILAIAIQMYTGVPVLSMIFGGVKFLFKGDRKSVV